MPQSCPFCFSDNYTLSYLPPTFFNNKQFSYYNCKSCNLHYVHPLPDAGDFDAMYPPAYQSGVNTEICADPYNKIGGIRFSYGRQFDLIRKHAAGNRILDYGCGNANFLINATHHGFTCDGAEYNKEHVDILKRELPGSNFYLLEDFFNDAAATYDVIRLSNVLEHLTNPREITQKLVSKLNPKGILIIEGPVENNFTVALLIRKLYFKLRRNRIVSHVPTHIFFSDSANQRAFFKQYPLHELHFELEESEWPFPEKWEQVTGITSAFMFVAAKVSMMLRPLSRNWGNTFIYVGQKI